MNFVKKYFSVVVLFIALAGSVACGMDKNELFVPAYESGPLPALYDQVVFERESNELLPPPLPLPLTAIVPIDQPVPVVESQSSSSSLESFEATAKQAGKRKRSKGATSVLYPPAPLVESSSLLSSSMLKRLEAAAALYQTECEWYEEPAALVENKKSKKEKRFPCTHPGCGEKFTNNSRLDRHMRTHSHEKPYKCNTEGCKAAYAANSDLTRHKRIHTGERPYVCEHKGCGEMFVYNNQLSRHMKTHRKNGCGKK